MVFKCPFLKQRVVQDYDPAADGDYTWDLTDEALAAIWLTIKGDLVAADQCIDDILLSLTGIDMWFGSFNVMHYTTGIKAYLMNCKLKQHHGYLVHSSQTIDDVTGISFPLMFGAPYLDTSMAIPHSLTNRKRLTLSLDIATAALDDLLIDISEVLLPDAHPVGFIKQEELAVSAPGTGDHDIWLQTNWDILKLMLHSPTVPSSTSFTSTIERAGVEINDFPFGYKNVPWEHLHAEIMDELEGSGPVENHQHADPSAGVTGMPYGLEHWIAEYGELDFFFEKQLKWKLPCAGASTAKLKYNCGVDEAFSYVTASYVPSARA